MIEGDPFAPRRGLRCAAFLESGTLNATVAVLLQIGLPSRRVAQEVVAREGLTLITVATLRAWLRAQRNEPDTRWSYLADAIRPIWISFLADSTAPDNDAWATRFVRLRLNTRYDGRLEFTGAGVLCRVAPEGTVIGEFQTPDGTPVGNAAWPFSMNGPSYAEAFLHPSDEIEVTYVGPNV